MRNMDKYKRNIELTGSSFCKRRLLRDFMSQKSFHQVDLKGHFGCVNAIEFSWGLGSYIASGGDDKRVLLWNVERALSGHGSPATMDGQHNSNIFCINFDVFNKKIFSGGNDEQVLIHDTETGKLVDVYLHDDVVYGLTTDPSSEYIFASACDDGSALIYDIREPSSDAFTLIKYSSPMHAVVYNSVDARLLATANSKEGVALWDIRRPRHALMRYGSTVQQSCMSVKIGATGERLIAIRRRLPLVLYDLSQRLPLCEFDHESYYNSCTMKSCSFAGQGDEYVLSGSDDFNLYMWKIPDDLSNRRFISEASIVLKGHRSIVNQVRSNPCNNLIISSGVEKVIKAWSPFKLHKSTVVENDERTLYTHEEYINLILNSGSGMSHDYSHQSVDEEPQMMAFFDSLVQREIEGWSSEDEASSNDDELYRRIVQLPQSESGTSQSSDSDNEGRLSPFSRGFVSVVASLPLVENTAEARLLGAADDRPTAQNNDLTIYNEQESMINSHPPLLDTKNLENNDSHPTSKEMLTGVNHMVCESSKFHLKAGARNNTLVTVSGISDTTTTVVYSTSSSSSSSDSLCTVVLSRPSCEVPVSTSTYRVQVSDSSQVVIRLTDTISNSVPSHDVSWSTVNRTCISGNNRQPSTNSTSRCISNLIALKRKSQNSLRNKHSVKHSQRICSSESSEDEKPDLTSSGSVRAKVLSQTISGKQNKDVLNVTSRYRSIKNLRRLVVYSSDESENNETAPNDMLVNKEINIESECRQNLPISSCTTDSYNCDIDVNISSIKDCTHGVCSTQTVFNNVSATFGSNIQSVHKSCDSDAPYMVSLNTPCLSTSSCSESLSSGFIQNLPRGTDDRVTSSTPTQQPLSSLTDKQVFSDSRTHVSKDSDKEVHLSASTSHCDNAGIDRNFAPESSEGNDQPLWMEFKRFKNRLKKAERYYRNRSKKNHKSEEKSKEKDDN